MGHGGCSVHGHMGHSTHSGVSSARGSEMSAFGMRMRVNSAGWHRSGAFTRAYHIDYSVRHTGTSYMSRHSTWGLRTREHEAHFGERGSRPARLLKFTPYWRFVIRISMSAKSRT